MRTLLGRSEFHRLRDCLAGMTGDELRRQVVTKVVGPKEFKERLVRLGELVRDGRINPHSMRHALLTKHNLAEAVRQTLGRTDIDDVGLSVLERDGKITVTRAEQ